MRAVDAPGALGGPPTSRADVAPLTAPEAVPLEQVSAVSLARLAVHRAATEWSSEEVQLLADLLSFGTPTEVLSLQRMAKGAGFERGGEFVNMPPMTARSWARGSALALYSALDVQRGGRVLGAPQGEKAR